MKIACIGEAMIELSTDGVNANIGVAGDTLNTAVYLKRCAPHIDVHYVTCIGADDFSKKILAFISKENIDTTYIEQDPNGTPGLYAITNDANGERSFTYWRSQSAARQLFSDSNFEFLKNFDAIYLSGITLAILPATVREAWLKWLMQHKITVIYDSNHRPKLWEDLITAKSVNTLFTERADILLPSVDDEMEIYSETELQVSERHFGVRSFGILKRAEKGPISLGFNSGQVAFDAVEEFCDSTAAGDSFNGAFLASWFTHKNPVKAMIAGHKCAAYVIQKRGAIVPNNPIFQSLNL